LRISQGLRKGASSRAARTQAAGQIEPAKSFTKREGQMVTRWKRAILGCDLLKQRVDTRRGMR
jgi:hypothetical protein